MTAPPSTKTIAAAIGGYGGSMSAAEKITGKAPAATYEVVRRDGRAVLQLAGRWTVFTIGALDNDLAIAVNKALRMDRRAAAVFGASFSWSRATDQFFAAVEAAARRSTGQRALQPA